MMLQAQRIACAWLCRMMTMLLTMIVLELDSSKDVEQKLFFFFVHVGVCIRVHVLGRPDGGV
jgi:hypothetical protein